MSYLLDTCVVSEFVKPRPDDGLMTWIDGQDETRMHLSALTFGELTRGIERMAPGARRSRLQGWLDSDLKARFSGRVLPADSAVCVRWGMLQGRADKRGRPMSVIDSLIAATAAVHGLTLVTRNVGDVKASGVAVLNPWGGVRG